MSVENTRVFVVTTTDGTVQVIGTYEVPIGHIAEIEAHFLAIEPATGNGYVSYQMAAVKRVGAGDAVRIGGTIIIFEKKDTTGQSGDIDVAGTTCRITIKGSLNKTYQWAVWFTVSHLEAV